MNVQIRHLTNLPVLQSKPNKRPTMVQHRTIKENVEDLGSGDNQALLIKLRRVVPTKTGIFIRKNKKDKKKQIIKNCEYFNSTGLETSSCDVEVQYINFRYHC